VGVHGLGGFLADRERLRRVEGGGGGPEIGIARRVLHPGEIVVDLWDRVRHLAFFKSSYQSEVELAGVGLKEPRLFSLPAGIGDSPAVTLANPFPNGITQPTGSSAGLATFVGQNIVFLNPQVKDPYSVRWNFGFQHAEAGGIFQPRMEPAQRDDTNWIALARPDLLILVNQKELLNEILERILHGSQTRALPAALPEWTQVDRTTPFWGLRHYTTRSKPKPGERGCEAAELPQPDCTASGVTVRFDTVQQRLEVRYLSETELAQHGMLGNGVRREFRVDQPQSGVWRLVSDVQKSGPWPVHFALVMLGFGMYR
jgi:hypothetical protein